MGKCGKPAGECNCPRPAMDIEPHNKIQVTGGSGMGKSRWVVRDLILHKDSAYKGGVIYLCCHEMSRKQKEYQFLKQNYKGKIIDVDLPKDSEQEKQLFDAFKKTHGENKHQTIIFDDLMLDTKNKTGKTVIERCFIAGRHVGLGVILIEQSPMTNRLARMNTDVFVLFDTSLASAIAHLARELHPESRGARVMRCYRQSTSKKHGYLIVDVRSGQGKRKFRDSSFENVYNFDLL